MGKRFEKSLAILLAMILTVSIAGCAVQSGSQNTGSQESTQGVTEDGTFLPEDAQDNGGE